MARINYGVIATKYRALGKGNVRLTQSSLFLRKPIDATKTVYNFDVLENQTQSLQADEIRLNINDEFITTQMGLYLTGTISTRDGVVTQLGGLRLFTNVLEQQNLTQASNLIPFYDGDLKIAVNNIVYMEKWDTRKHYVATRTQIGSSSSVTTINNATWDSNTFAKDGMYSVEPMITLSGAKKNDITLRLPSAISNGAFNYTDSAGNPYTITINGIALLLRGLNAQNAASFQ
jgi:hypothetical protein